MFASNARDCGDWSRGVIHTTSDVYVVQNFAILANSLSFKFRKDGFFNDQIEIPTVLKSKKKTLLKSKNTNIVVSKNTNIVVK